MKNNFIKVLLSDSRYYSHFVFSFHDKVKMEQINSMLSGYGIEMEQKKYAYGICVNYSGIFEKSLDWFMSVFRMYGFEVYSVGMYF